MNTQRDDWLILHEEEEEPEQDNGSGNPNGG